VFSDEAKRVRGEGFAATTTSINSEGKIRIGCFKNRRCPGASEDRSRFVSKQREAVSRTFGKASFDDQVKSILTRTFYGLPAR
jgi:hypothetical protein